MKQTVLLASIGFVCLLAIPAAAAPDGGRNVRFTAGVDYSVGSNANKTFEDDTANAANIATALGYDTVNGKTTTTEGAGARVGVMLPVEKVEGLEFGSSLGYYIGPKAEQIIDASVSGTLPATFSNTVKTNFIRWIGEGTKTFPLSKVAAFKIGVGAGIAQGKAKQDTTYSGSAVTNLGLSNTSTSETWTGFTWEASPSLVVGLDHADLEFGIRYAQFPTHKESDNISKIVWSPLFLFMSVSF